MPPLRDLGTGPARKMAVRRAEPVAYALPLGTRSVGLNPLLGRTVLIEWLGRISCVHCGRGIKKSYSQGYCYLCFKALAQCDLCVVRPELCHYHQGTCREPGWGETHCLIPHTVYLANSSGLKVGITRGLDPTARWIDQGATQGLAVRTVASRLDSGRLETALKALVADRTSWRTMLRGPAPALDLVGECERLFTELAAVNPGFVVPGEAAGGPAATLDYPVLEYPAKVRSHDLDKAPRLEGSLLGIKGQYLIFDAAVINIRKYAGYWLRLAAGGAATESNQ